VSRSGAAEGAEKNNLPRSRGALASGAHYWATGQSALRAAPFA